MIVHVFPLYFEIPSTYSDCYIDFYWSELLLYKPFQNIPNGVGSYNEEIIAN